MIDYKTKYEELIVTLNDANDAGLFDLKTSNLASINSEHRQKIRAALREANAMVEADFIWPGNIGIQND